MKSREVVCLLLGASGMALAQQPAEPEVRRALPVDRDGEMEIRRALPVSTPTPPAVDSYQNPAWMSRVQPSPTPQPVQPPPGPEPGFTPYRPSGRVLVNPTPEPQPTAAPAIPEPRAVPAEPATPSQPVATPTPDANGVIRLSPGSTSTDPGAKELETANGLYARKMYDYAVTEYEKFLISYPNAPKRDQAMFRLAESHRLLGNDTSARRAYERVLQETQQGEFAGAAAYRLGEYLLADKLYDAAATQFQTASQQAASAEVRLSASYQQARALEKLNRKEDAVRKYAEVAAITKDNPYRNYARLSLAQLYAGNGRKKEALDEFSTLASEDGPPTLRAEAAVKAAALAAELGDSKKASDYFDKALAIPDLGDWKPIAILGALRTNYALGNYQKVTTQASQYMAELPTDTKAEALMLQANSYRQLGNAQQAKALYDQLITQFPDAGQALDARFQQLLSMYQLDDPQLLPQVDAFLQRSTDPKLRAQATLLKAETLFKKQSYAEAGPLYADILVSKLDDDIKGKAMIKLGWCQTKTGQYEPAVATFSNYLQKYPKGASALAALVQRGLARQELKDYDAALKDFDDVIANHPDAKERELALQQKALILGQQKNYTAMADAYRQLLKDYPKSSAAGQANFWIGWTAYENKDYKAAIESLEAARKADPAQYAERATLRILLCYYYLQDREGLKRAIVEARGVTIPPEINRWLGRQSFAEGDYAEAEKYLLVAVKDGQTVEPDTYIELAEAQIKQGKAAEAAPYADGYLQSAREPYARARGLLAKGYVAVAKGQYEDAVKLDEEAMLLQPEGPLNAAARLLSGEISYARGDYDGAAKAFLTLAVLYDDPAVTPQALERAAAAYRKTGNTFEAEKALKELQQRFPNYKKSPKLTQDTP